MLNTFLNIQFIWNDPFSFSSPIYKNNHKIYYSSFQEKLEDWRRQVATIDKEHAKEYKRCRTELKKRSNDTLRLQKKARKDQSDTIQSLVDSHMQDVTLRRAELEEVERKSLRAAMIEERMRYCSFVNMLQPVVKEECEVMSELGHLQVQKN